MLAFAAFLVDSGWFESVELIFLVVGHTKFAPDRMFGWFGRLLKKNDVFAIKDLEQLYSDSVLAKTFSAHEIDEIDDWSWLHEHFRPPVLFKHYHVFRVTKQLVLPPPDQPHRRGRRPRGSTSSTSAQPPATRAVITALLYAGCTTDSATIDMRTSAVSVLPANPKLTPLTLGSIPLDTLKQLWLIQQSVPLGRTVQHADEYISSVLRLQEQTDAANTNAVSPVDKITVEQLKSMLRAVCEPTSGDKMELLHRLDEHYRKKATHLSHLDTRTVAALAQAAIVFTAPTDPPPADTDVIPESTASDRDKCVLEVNAWLEQALAECSESRDSCC